MTPDADDIDLDAEMEAEAAEAQAAAEQSSHGERLAAKVEEVLKLDQEIDDLELLLKTAKEDREDLKRRQIPSILDEVGVPELTVKAGNRLIRVAIDNKAYGSFNYAEDQDAAVKLLEGAGFEGGVLTKASVDLKTDELHLLEEIGRLVDEKFGKDVNITRDIHHSTLRAFVRQAMEKHPDFDAKAVGVTMVREAKLTAR